MIAILRRILNERGDYGTWSSWWTNLYNRLLRRLPRAPLPGRGKVVSLSMAHARAPVAVRLGTSDILVAREIFSQQEYGQTVRRLPNLQMIVDLGANIGLSVHYWREAYAAATIIGVEPDCGNARLCRLNARVSDQRSGRTFIIRACAGGSPRKIMLDRSDDAWTFRIGADAHDAQHPDAVPVLTIPQILARAGCTEPIDLLKCDIEGGEAELFESCRPWIANVRHMIVEIHPPYTPEKLLHALAENGGAFDVVDKVDKGGGLQVASLSSRLP